MSTHERTFKNDEKTNNFCKLRHLSSQNLYEGIVKQKENEPVHEIPNNVVCATSKASDQPAHTRSLIRDFASRLSIL